MAEQGLLGICLPVRYGGEGMDYLSLGIACEELERVDTSARVIMSVHVGLNSLALLQWATEEQKQEYLVPQAMGDRIGTYALTEPDAGSDAVGIKARARKVGDEYILNGEKMWISLADVADNFIIIAYTDPEKRHRGMSAFIVEREFPGHRDGHDSRQDGRARRQHGLDHAAGLPRAGQEPVGRRGRRLQDRHERARQRPVHRGLRRAGG